LRLASVSEAEGRRFEFCLGHQLILPASRPQQRAGVTPLLALRREQPGDLEQYLENTNQIQGVVLPSAHHAWALSRRASLESG
jgi:hypothetical protein